MTVQQPPRQPAIPNNIQRIITGLVVIPILIIGIIVGGWLFTLMLLPIIGIGLLEFYWLAKGKDYQGLIWVGIPAGILIGLAYQFQEMTLWHVVLALAILITFVAQIVIKRDIEDTLGSTGMTLGGLIYVAFPLSFLIALRSDEANGILLIALIFVTTISADTFAYYGGRMFGGKVFGERRLAPKISPNKTIEGAICGVVGSVILTTLVLALANLLTLPMFLLMILAPIVSIIGDLFESFLKRRFGVKDSGIHGLNPFPGHGGVLDRTDSLLWVSAFYYLTLNLIGVI